MDCFRLRSLSYGGQVVACGPRKDGGALWARHSGAISNFRVRFAPRNDGLSARHFISSGTAASYFELCSTSDVLTLRTCGAAVRWVTNSWNVAMSGATHFRMKSTSPDSIQHSRTSGSPRPKTSHARETAHPRVA